MSFIDEARKAMEKGQEFSLLDYMNRQEAASQATQPGTNTVSKPAATQQPQTPAGVQNYLDWNTDFDAFAEFSETERKAREGTYQSADSFSNYAAGVAVRAGDMLRRTNYILEDFEKNRSTYDKMFGEGTTDDAIAGMNQRIQYLNSISKDLEESKKFWDQFSSEDEYNAWIAQGNRQEYLSSFDIEAGKQVVEDLQKQRDALAQQTLGSTMGQRGSVGAGLYEGQKEKIAELDKQITSATLDVEQAQALKNKSYYDTLAQNRDFSQYAQEGAAIRTSEDDLFYGNVNYREMEKSEKDVYHYLLAKKDQAFRQGDRSAVADYERQLREYLFLMEGILNERQGKREAEFIKNLSSVPRFFAQMDSSLDSGVSNYLSGLRQYAHEGAVAPSASQYAFENFTKDMGFGGKAFFGAIQNMGQNAIPMLSSMLPGGGFVQPILTGVSAAGNAYSQGLSMGMTKKQAKTYGTLVGSSEALLEKLLNGFGGKTGVAPEKLLDNVSHIESGFVRAIFTAGINIGSEEIEELAQTFLEPLFSSVVMDTEYDAPTWEEIAYTAAVTFLSTGAYNVGNVAHAAGEGGYVPKSADAKTAPGTEAGAVTPFAKGLGEQETPLSSLDGETTPLQEMPENEPSRAISEGDELLRNAAMEMVTPPAEENAQGTDLREAPVLQSTVTGPAVQSTPVPANSPASVTANRSAEVQAVDKADVSAMADTLGDLGKSQMSEIYLSDTQSAEEYIPAFISTYRAGQQGAEMPASTVLTQNQREMAYFAGQIDAQNEEISVASNSQLGYNEGTYNETGTEGQNGQEGRSVYLRNSGQRDDGTYTAIPVSGMEEGTGRSQTGQEAFTGDGSQKKENSRRVAQEDDRKVSAKQLGLSTGTDHVNLRVVRSENEVENDRKEDYNQAVSYAAENGLELVSLSGMYIHVSENGKTFPVNAAIQKGKAFVPVDNPYFTSYQLIRHEHGHDLIRKGIVKPDDIMEKLETMFTEEELVQFKDDYATAYVGTDLTPDDIWIEAVCDAMGEMNIFETVGMENRVSGVMDAVYKIANDQKTSSHQRDQTSGNSTGDSSEIRYSITSLASAAGLNAQRDTDGIHFYMNGKRVQSVTANHIREHSGLGGLIRVTAQNGFISKEEADIQYKSVADLMNMILTTQDPEMIWAYAGAELFSAYRKNSDGQYSTTVDFSTICRKTQDMIDAMSKAMVSLGRGLTKNEIVKLQGELKKDGTVPCPVCYVFSRWAGVGKLLDTMWELQEKYAGYSTEELRQVYNSLLADAKKQFPELVDKKSGKPTSDAIRKLRSELADEQASLEAELEKLSEKSSVADYDEMKAYRIEEINRRLKEIDPKLEMCDKTTWFEYVRLDPKFKPIPKDVLYDLNKGAEFSKYYPGAWKYRTTRGSGMGKAIMPYSDIRLGDILAGADKLNTKGQQAFRDNGAQFSSNQMNVIRNAIKRAKAQNLIGGQRYQSTSDFRYDYALDYLQSFFEVQAMGSYLQTYTKIVEFAEMVARIGGDVNLSVMPRGKGYEDGKLIFSAVTGINYDGAVKVAHQFDSAQLILVGINDEHILLALEDSEDTGGVEIGMVIPYHASGASEDMIAELVRNLGEEYVGKMYVDYSPVQTDSEKANATADQIERRRLRKIILTGKSGGKNRILTQGELDFIRGENVSIEGRSFEDLLEVEKKALAGDEDAIREYTSWSNGMLWDLYQKLWVSDGENKGARLNSTQAANVMPHEYWDKSSTRKNAYVNGFLFRSYCYNLGLIPRFTGIKSDGSQYKYGDFSESAGYWKTLIDRSMYDLQGNYRDQQRVNLTGFDNEMLKPSYGQNKYGEYKVKEPNRENAERVGQAFADSVSNDSSSNYSRALGFNADTAEYNEILQEKVNYWKGQTKRTTAENRTVRKGDVEKLARRLVRDYDSTLSAGDIAADIQALGDFIVRGGDGENELTWAEVKDRAVSIARNIAQNAEVLASDGEAEIYREIRSRLHKQRIAFHDQSDIADYGDFRKRNMGKFILAKDGLPMDVLWMELNSTYGESYFPSDITHPADQLMHLAELLDSMKPIYENPFSYHMAEATEYIANDIIDSLLSEDIRQTPPTFADRQVAKLDKQKADDRERLERLRTQKNERIAELRRQGQERTREALRRVRADRDAKITALKEHYRTKEAKSRDSRRAAELRKKIQRHVKELSSTLLRPSDKHHVPDALRGPVARLLEAINLESNYELEYGRDARYHRVKPGESLYSEATKRTQAFAELRKAYAEIAGELVIDPNLMGQNGDPGLFDEVATMASKPIAEMNTTELETIWQTIRAVEASIRSANKMFAAARFHTVSELAEALRRDNAGKKEKRQYNYIGWLLKLTSVDMLTPEAFLHRLGDGGDVIFRMMRNAQDEHIRIMKAVSDFTHDELGDVNVKALETELHTVTLGGEEIKLSTAQLMELYALMRREQAQAHILTGGILPDMVSTKGIKKIARTEPLRSITPEEVSNALSLLTAEQIAITERLQEYASTTLSDFGNKASMEVYNYKKFTEEHYWPIRSNKQETKSTVEKDTATTSVANRGFTKATKPNANTSVRLGSIFDTFSTHASEMATYAAWLGTSEDINRIRNFTFRDGEGHRMSTVKGIIDRVHGKDGSAYLQKLLSDIANGVKGTHGETEYMGGLVGNYKAAAVGANLRVIIQQPTAILRALDMIDPQYLMAGIRPGGWEKALRYAPIAQWKDWGYFDINTGRQMKDVLFESDSKLEKVKQASMWMAGKMDSLAWGQLWNAVEAETKAKRKELKPGTKEFYDAVAKRFTEIIDRTQVVDGILQRSQIMRSASGLTKMATSFMGEPTKQYNMLLNSAYDARHATGKEQRTTAKKRLARTAVALTVSGVVNAMAQSIIDAVRDDDKEKDYWEKWLSAFTGFTGEEEGFGEHLAAFWSGNLESIINPAQYIPYVKDVVSILQGYDVSRMDMESIDKTISAAQNMLKALNGDGKYTIAGASANLFAEGARLLGIPVANFKRDVKAIAMTAAIESDNYLMQYRMEKAALNMNYPNNRKTFLDILYHAYVSDREAYELIYADMVSSGFEPDKIRSGMEDRMKADQGVSSVSDLDSRYLSPDDKQLYDEKLAPIQKSSVWKRAGEEGQKKLESNLYDLITENSNGKKLQEKIDGGASYGLDEGEYLLYLLALSITDTPSESGKYGTYTVGEVEQAIRMLQNLSEDERDYLWTAAGKNQKTTPDWDN